MPKLRCNKCKEFKDIDQFYVCMNNGRPQVKKSCKYCFNREKHRNARERRRQELFTGKALPKYSKLEINTESFSKHPARALKEGDLRN